MLILASLLPPLDFDVCEYHLQAPKEFFQHGKIDFLPHNVYANMPMGAEMLSLLAMSIAGDWWPGALAGKLVTAMFTPLLALGLLAAGRRFCSTAAGVVAALVYISIPLVLSVSAAGLVDGVLACYLFLAFYAVLLWKSPLSPGEGQGEGGVRPTGCLLLAGYFAGAAAATKYSGILYVLLPLAGWIVLGRGAGDEELQICRLQFAFRRRLLALVVFLLAAGLGCGLWYGKNWILTGNPTYPLFYGVLDGKTWNAEKDSRWNRIHGPHDFAPQTLAADAGRVVLTSPGLSPLVVPLAALALLGCLFKQRGTGQKSEGEEKPTRTRPLAVPFSPSPPLPLSPSWGISAYALFILAAWWLLTHRIDRFWMPALPLLALLGGVGATWCGARWWRWLLTGLLVAGLAANFLMASAGWNNAWFVPLPMLRHDPHWIKPWHEYFNAQTADGGVLAVGEAAVFDFKPPVLYNTCFDDCIFQRLVEGRTARQVAAELRSRHIAYVYVDWPEIERYRSPGNYGFTHFVQPAVFDWLVHQGVLTPLDPIEGSAARAYRVAAPGDTP
jgi:hypothetical protein